MGLETWKPTCSANSTDFPQYPPNRTLGLQDIQLTAQCLEMFRVTLWGDISRQVINKLIIWNEAKSGVLETEIGHQKEKMRLKLNCCWHLCLLRVSFILLLSSLKTGLAWFLFLSTHCWLASLYQRAKMAFWMTPSSLSAKCYLNALKTREVPSWNRTLKHLVPWFSKFALRTLELP